MEYTKFQKALAEFIGPFALVFVGGGAAILASFQAGGASLVTVGLAHGLVIATMVSAVGHISGGHLNPAVTIGAWVTQKISSSLALIYIVAQIAGGVLGAFLLKVSLPKAVKGSPAFLGATTVNRQAVSNGQAVLIEAVLTFFLVWVIFAVAIDPQGSYGKIAGLAIGFVIAMDSFMGGPLTGAAMNPARSLGPALIANKWTGIWVYLVGPTAGAIVAAALYDGVMLRPRRLPEDEELPDTMMEEASIYGEGEEPVVSDVDMTEGSVGTEHGSEEHPHGFGAHGDESETH
jgi:MIP family channel proteins